MAKFCGKCGAKLDEKTGKCPKCDSEEQISNNKENGKKRAEKSRSNDKHSKKVKAKKEKVIKKKEILSKPSRKKRKIIKRVLVIFLLVLVLLIMCLIYIFYKNIDIPIISDLVNGWSNKIFNNDSHLVIDNIKDVDDLEEIDVGEATRSKVQVLETIDVKESGQSMTEAEVATYFQERGFGSSEVTTMFSMDGTYIDEEIIDEKSEIEHPLYSGIYVSNENFYWMIYYCNGFFSAEPLSYNLNDTTLCEVLISETDYIMSYDSDTNCFYKIIPDEKECIVIEVSQINAETLDILASRELGE